LNDIIFKGPPERTKLPELLEGYLFGMGEVCNTLFGKKGEEAMYLAVGSYFLRHLSEKMGIRINHSNPWERYCQLIELFTKHGFYSYVKLKKLANDSYWMLEKDQYAGQIWEDNKSWERGSAPCPLWTLILASLAEIDYGIVLDNVTYDNEAKGFESTFHFDKQEPITDNILTVTRKKILASMITFCSKCKKVKQDNNEWIEGDLFLYKVHGVKISHGYCPDCYNKEMMKVDKISTS
jgi:hypothetical protein